MAQITYTVRRDCRLGLTSYKPGDSITLDDRDPAVGALLAKGTLSAPPAPEPKPKRTKAKAAPEPDPTPAPAMTDGD